MKLDLGRQIIPVALFLPDGPAIVGHFELPASETILDDGRSVGIIDKGDAPELLKILMHDAPELSGTYHRPPPEGYSIERE